MAFVGLGFRADLMTARALMFLAVKFAFTVGIVGLALLYLARLARPGGERKILPPLLCRCAVLVIMVLAAISLGSAPARIGKG